MLRHFAVFLVAFFVMLGNAILVALTPTYFPGIGIIRLFFVDLGITLIGVGLVYIAVRLAYGQGRK